MWSKTKKALESRLADCLRDRVYYTFARHIYYDNQWDYQFPIFYIRVDKETWFATNPQWHDKVAEYASRLSGRKYNGYYGGRNGVFKEAVDMATKEMGTLDMFGYTEHEDYLMEMVHNYLNVYTIEECMNHGNYFYRILAVLDRRTGKRKIKALLDNIDNEPEWFRKYITLRATAQNII
ncbi:MAG: hypothetical protein K2J39_02310 [Ruminococcus sp.]|nr:hypothetical protein [Ruminococcus sp.]